MRWISAACLALITSSTPLIAETIIAARFGEPTGRYAHGVLGDAVEWGALEIDTENLGSGEIRTDAVERRATYLIRLPLDHVFEDISPRLVDVTGNGQPEVIVIETDVARGASLAVYTQTGKLAQTPHIGQTNRWLAPVAAADLDGDGYIEIAYVDRPHLAKTLRIWRYRDGVLTEVASQPGHSNHRIGWDFIAGGLRDCEGVRELITANASYTRILATRFDGHTLHVRDAGRYTGPASLSSAASCD